MTDTALNGRKTPIYRPVLMDDAQIIADLRSGNIERQVAALQEAARAIMALLSEAVRTLTTTDAPFAVASPACRGRPAVDTYLLKNQFQKY